MASKKEKISDDELLAVIDRRKSSAINYTDDNLSTRRRNLLSRYMGEKYGTERNGQSSVVTRECLEAVEWTLPSLLRIFLSTPTVAEFNPVGPEDEQAAKQETFAVNKVLQQNDGFMTLFSWIKDTLMNMNAYIKVYWDESESTSTEEYEGLNSQEVQQLLNEEGVEAIGQDVRVIEIPTPMGVVPMEVFDLKIRRTTKTGKLVVDPTPQEELTIDGKLTKVSLEEADFVNHTTLKTRSELVEMGFDKEVIYDLAANPPVKDEKAGRFEVAVGENTAYNDNEANDEATELIEVDETYLYIDYDNDGIAEFRKVISVSDTILENEECDMLPFVAMTSVPLPHSHVGIAWQELVEDLQKINTTLHRQLFNNMYRTNNPRTVVGRGVNISDLISDLPNQPIRAQNIDQLRTEPIAPIIGQVLPAFEHIDKMKESRTGVSRSTMGLDADQLARVANGAFLGSLEQANQRLEALARVIAESGIKPLMLKIHRLLLTHKTEAYNVKQGNQWIQVNPTEWRERDDMTITVGLGTGNKQAQMMAIDKLFGVQSQMIQTGKGHLVSDQNVYNTAAKLVEITGLHNAENYFSDPAKMPPPPPPQPDPLIEVQNKLAQVELMKVQLKAQSDQAEMQAKIQELQLKLRQDNKELMLKAKDLERKEYEVLLKSELEQAKLDKENMRDLNAVQEKAKDSFNE